MKLLTLQSMTITFNHIVSLTFLQIEVEKAYGRMSWVH